MSQKLTIVAISLLLLIFNCGAGSAVENEFKYSSNENKQVFTKQVNPVEDFGRIPLYFIPNKGQADASAQFYAKASNYTLWVTKEGLVFDKIRKNESGNTAFPRVKSDIKNHSEADPYWNAKEGSIETVTKARVKGNTGCQYERNVSRLSFIGANENPKISAGEATDYRVNYFMGNDKRNWRTDIETSASIIYENLYENIDFKVYGLEKQIEYDWIVRPGADPNKILFEYRNVKSIKIAEDGNLVVHTAFGDLVHKKPAGYQIIRGERVEVNVEFKKSSNRSYGFKVSEYNKDYPLIIDPLIVDYSTYLGGLSGQIGRGIAVDSSGSAYVAGYTSSSDFPMLNQYQGDQGTTDAFVTKLTPAGNGLAYSTYLGGGDQDYGYAIAVDSSGSAYVTGCTISSDFPMLNQYQGDQGATDAFVTKLTPSGNGLAYSTYLGGSGNDYGNAIAVDSSGSAYVTGETLSADFPTVNQYQGSLAGTTDAFVTKLAPAGNTLAYSTYLGGGGGDYGHAIAVDSSGSAYVTGYTSSANFPTLNQYQGSLAGTTDAFVTKLTHAGNSLVYSTYLGGGGQDNGNAIAVDSSGSAYVTGETLSADFPTVNQYQGPQGNYDVFVTKITPAGNSLYYSTYLGGNSMDNVRRIAVDSSGSAYVTGETYSSDFPTVNQYQGSLAGAYDVFVTKLTWRNPNTEPTAVITADRFGGIAPLMIAFDGSGSYDRDGRVVDWMWDFGDGTTGTGEQITHEYASSGTYNVTLRVGDNDGEWSRPAQETVLVLNDTESLICVIEIIPNSFKANGKATGIIVATLYQKSQDDSGSADLLLTNIGLKFSPAKGSLSGDMFFENSSGKYSMILVSGEPGTDTVSAILDGFTLASSNVVYTWPQPPLNLNVVMKEDRGLFKGVYYSYLYWSANTSDIYAPALYKIYRSTNGSAFENIGTTNASTFEYVDSNVAAGKSYTYAVSTVDVDGDESALSAPVNAY